MSTQDIINAPKKRWPWLVIGFVLLVLSLGLLGAVAYQNRVAVAQWGIQKGASQFNFPDMRFKVREVELDRLSLSDVWLGPDLKIDSVTLHYDLPSLLMAQKVDRLLIQDVSIETRDLNTGALGKIQQLASQDQTDVARPILMPDITIENISIRLHMENAALDLSANAHINPDLSAMIQARGAASYQEAGQSLDIQNLSLQVEAKANLSDIKVQIDQTELTAQSANISIKTKLGAELNLSELSENANITAKLSLSDSSLISDDIQFSAKQSKAVFNWPTATVEIKLPFALIQQKDQQVKISNLIAIVRRDAKSGDITFSIPTARLDDTKVPVRFNAFLLKADGLLKDQILSFDGASQLEKGKPFLKAKGQHDLKRGEGSVHMTVPNLSFKPTELQPKDFAPALDIIEETTGSISGQSDIKWSNKGLKTQGAITLSDLSLTTDTASIQGINTTLDLSSLWPPETRKIQKLTVREIASGIRLEHPLVEFSIKKGRLQIHRFLSAFLGGEISIKDMKIDPNTQTQNLRLDVKQLDLDKLFRLIELDGLSGTGRMTGSLPLTLSSDDITLEDTELVSEEAGVLRFRSEKARQALSGAGEQVELLLNVLNDFHYDKLSLSLKREVSHNAFVGLHIEGHNPAVMDGRAFHLNINLEGNVDRLLATLLEGYRLSDRAIRASLLSRQ
jgi:hypothetical protein